MTELYINDILIDLDPDDVVAITKVVNDLAEIKNRNSDFTNEFNAPKTENNIGAFGLANVINSDTDIPYRKQPARLVQNGREIVPRGFAIIEDGGDQFSISVYSGNLDFFEKIEDKKLVDLDWSSLTHTWNLVNQVASRSNTTGFIYALIDYGGLPETPRTIDVSKQIPAIFKHWIADKIVTEAGYTLSGNVLANNEYLNILMTLTGNQPILSTLLAEADSGADLVNDSAFNLNQLASFNIDISDPRNQIEVETFPVSGFPGGSQTVAGFKAAVKGTYTIKCDVPFEVIGPTVTIQLMIVPDGTNSLFFPGGSGFHKKQFTAPESGTLNFERANIPMNKGDRIVLHMNSNAGGGSPNAKGTIFAGAKLHVTKAESDGIELGDEFEIEANLPDISQTDFLKAIMQQFAIFPVTDVIERDVQFIQMEELYDNIPLAEDWSELINLKGESGLEFRFGDYGQVNELNYKPDDSVTENLGNGTFNVDDETLDGIVELFELIYAASDMVIKLDNIDVPSVPLIDSSGFFKNNIEPRCLLLDRLPLPLESPVNDLVYDSGAVMVSINTDIPYARFILTDKSKNLGFNNSLIPDHYTRLIDILTKAKKIREEFNLDENRIAERKPEIPVYLDVQGSGRSINGYFYVNLIDEYIEGEFTPVELIKLQSG